MGFFSKSFDRGEGSGVGSPGSRIIDLAREFASLEEWTHGTRFEDADARYSELIRGLPAGEATSMRLSESPGTISVSGERQRVFGYPGTIELNMPALTELADTSRILVDLGYSGVEQEAGGVARDIAAGTWGARFSCIPSRWYPLVRMQVSFYTGLREPLHLEVLSDILDRNVQDFYVALCDNGSYELSVHVMRSHLGSAFGSVPDDVRGGLAAGIASLVSGIRAIPVTERDMRRAVSEFERRHPLGEGM
ncbi:hypothetical protein CHL67_03560 [Prosthecochloris sp. GSB1]|uniref:hypothetical protein n=1 Tax=Prosthecochloris sp. GSB1 TaxID=281093 RepID=UPI000B8C7690|nr:hypothetical protein [Prosthecochloris sp. GSB1]ASQ90126.1 hypothetical protein CHL67_03560 [Prosthecochloris sp. GSB1]